MHKAKMWTEMNHEELESFKESIRGYFKDDLSITERQNIEAVIKLVLGVSSGEFKCDKCQEKQTLYFLRTQ